MKGYEELSTEEYIALHELPNVSWESKLWKVRGEVYILDEEYFSKWAEATISRLCLDEYLTEAFRLGNVMVLKWFDSYVLADPVAWEKYRHTKRAQP